MQCGVGACRPRQRRRSQRLFPEDSRWRRRILWAENQSSKVNSESQQMNQWLTEAASYYERQLLEAAPAAAHLNSFCRQLGPRPKLLQKLGLTGLGPSALRWNCSDIGNSKLGSQIFLRKTEKTVLKKCSRKEKLEVPDQRTTAAKYKSSRTTHRYKEVIN